MKKPDPFLVARINEPLGPHTHLVAMCVGYEQSRWRSRELVSHSIEWIPEFALREGELKTLGSENLIAKVRRAFAVLYDSKKFENRGEFGELLLHIVVRQVFNSVPAVSKIYFTDSVNVTVKGFDAVHVVLAGVDLELWLGEVKFYDSVASAIRDVVDELKSHVEANYLRKEFLLISNKLDPSSSFYGVLKKLLSPSTSLDEVFARIRIPVLLTYDSDVVGKSKKIDPAYVSSFAAEVRKHASAFFGKIGVPDIYIHLILVPLKTKTDLVSEFDSQVKLWQKL